MSLDGPTITVQRAGEILHCGRTKVFELVADGHIRTAPRFGRRATVYTEDVTRLALEGIPTRGRRRRAPAPRVATDAGIEAALARLQAGNPA